jgi:hypothetical protein
MGRLMSMGGNKRGDRVPKERVGFGKKTGMMMVGDGLEVSLKASHCFIIS